MLVQLLSRKTTRQLLEQVLTNKGGLALRWLGLVVRFGFISPFHETPELDGVPEGTSSKFPTKPPARDMSHSRDGVGSMFGPKVRDADGQKGATSHQLGWIKFYHSLSRSQLVREFGMILSIHS